MKDEFERGNLVMLKSGGPKMTVTHVDPDKEKKDRLVRCVWFKDAELRYADFLPEVIEITAKDE